LSWKEKGSKKGGGGGVKKGILKGKTRIEINKKEEENYRILSSLTQTRVTWGPIGRDRGMPVQILEEFWKKKSKDCGL